MSVAAIGTLNVSKPVRMEIVSTRDMHPEINWWCTAHGAPLNIYDYNVFHSHIEDFVILRSKNIGVVAPKMDDALYSHTLDVKELRQNNPSALG